MVAEHLSFFIGLGVVIVFLAAVAFGRLTVVGVRDAATDEVTWTKPDHGDDREEKPAEPDGERPSRWRRLTAAR